MRVAPQEHRQSQYVAHLFRPRMCAGTGTRLMTVSWSKIMPAMSFLILVSSKRHPQERVP
jgi:hypothetical protein